MHTTEAILACTNKKTAALMIKENLGKDNRWVIRAITVIHQRQTEDEKSSGHTRHHNCIGWSAFDAEIMSSFARQINSWDSTKYRTPLSPKQMVIARQKIQRYAGQVLELMKEKAAKEADARAEALVEQPTQAYSSRQFDEHQAEMAANGLV